MRVIVRVRPRSVTGSTELLVGEKEKDLESSIEGVNDAISVDSDENTISVHRGRKGQSEFSFSKVLDVNSKQETLYELCKDSINDVMNGINCSIVAYGQTGRIITLLLLF